MFDRSAFSVKSFLIVALTTCVAATGCANKGEGGTRGSAGSTGAGGDGSTVYVPEAELCGGQPCANYTGENHFTHPSAPDGVDSLFTGATRNPAGTNGANEPAIVYPSHETMFPINLPRVRFEWTEPAAGLAYELKFEGEMTTVFVYTAGGTFSPTEEEWDWVAESNRGGAVRFTVTVLDPADPGTAWTSVSIDLFFSDAAVPGAIYYWSTGTQGVMRARRE